MITTATSAASLRDQARQSSRELYQALSDLTLGLHPEKLAVLNDLIEQALADEYESGYATGYAQHPCPDCCSRPPKHLVA